MQKPILVSVLLSASLLLTGCQVSHGSSQPGASSTRSEAFVSAPQSEPQKLDAFDSIQIDVLAADLYVVPGDTWSISYKISEKEPLDHFGVEDGTLYFQTSFDRREFFDHTEEWFVTVTVPKDAALSELELKTLSGNVAVQSFSCEDAQLSTLSGTVEATDVRADALELETASGAITADALTSSHMQAKTISGDLSVSGFFDCLELKTVSGNTKAAGSISDSGTLESTSGDISLVLDHAAALEAESFGSITLNGTTSKSHLSAGSGVPVTIHSVSGKLSVQTEA